MSVIDNSLLLTAPAGGSSYQVSRSLRFNGPDSSFLSKNFASSGNQKTWTWAAWVKRSAGGAEQCLFSGGTGSNNSTFGQIIFANNDSLRVNGYSATWRETAQLFRDYSAWYHIIISFDTTQSTAANRVKVFVNGVQVTTFAQSSDPTQNTDYGINQADAHNIGKTTLASAYISAYFADVHFLDGIAVTDPAVFTTTDLTTGQLIPKAYTGSYGTNGFKLNFSDNSTTAALGTDTSGTDLGNAITTPASNAPPTVDYLIVGGGGGAGGDLSGGGGGGGVLASSVSLTSSTSYAVAVGTGGAGDSSSSAGLNGGNSSFNAIIALGGGGGAGDNVVATTGGSGGGGSTGGAFSAPRTGAAGTSGQGFAGGNGFVYPGAAGGGGGAGQAGSNGASANGTGGNGGNGVQSSITGTAVYYGGGGGGGGDSRFAGPAGTGGLGGGGNGGFGTSANGTNGTANTGGGGGGGSIAGGNGGNGGSGVVIIRYANTYADLSIGSGLTYSFANSGGYKIYTFTASTAANNWAVNNFSVTAGSGNDSLVDTPTSYGTDTGVGGEVRGNYATWNPLISSTNLTNGNLSVVQPSTTSASRYSTVGMSTGKWYWEISVVKYANTVFGIRTPGGGTLETPYDSSGYGMGWRNSGGFFIGGSNTGSGSMSLAAGDVLGLAFDADAGTLRFYKNGTLNNTLTASSTYIGQTWFAGSQDSAGGNSDHDVNFGQRAWAYTAPSNYLPLVDTLLPTPLVAKPDQVFQAKLYTGNGGTQSITGLAFSPDFIWCKGRSFNSGHMQFDIVRGGSVSLRSNDPDLEGGLYGKLSSFDSNGFTMIPGTDPTNPSVHNQNGQSYVTWTWDAGTSTVTNTSGSISAQVRANPSAGFSICTFTQPSSSSSFSWGHGLNVAPQLAIMKPRDSSGNWQVYHASTGAQYIWLNSTNAATGTGWSTVNSSIVTSTATLWQGSNVTTVAYCFAPVSGYSSMGTFTPTGTTDSSFVYCGFRPRLLLVKQTSNSSNWITWDTARDSYNYASKELYPNLSDAEVTNSSTYSLDILSNGFKMRNPGMSAGSTWIYCAWAESPFQYARAR